MFKKSLTFSPEDCILRRMKKLFSANIRHARPNGVRNVIVQSKDSYSARCAHRTEWETRILLTTSDLLQKGWKLAFFTLTYGTEKGYNYEGNYFNSHNVPHLPLELFKSVESYVETPCFDSKHISDFIRLLRDYYVDYIYHRKYSVNDLFQWAIFTEYGDKNARPHYHGICLFDPKFIDAEELWSKMREFWEGSRYGFHGFFGPHSFKGGDWCGTTEKPFLADDIFATAKYAAKYACKDIDFQNRTKKLDLWTWRDCPFEGGRQSPDWHPLMDYPNMIRRHFPFHKQSRMFGSCVLNGVDTQKKLDLLRNGVHIQGENKNRSAPQYVQRKILKNYYSIYDKDGNRKVRCEASDFFRENAADVYKIAFEKKKKFLVDGTLNLSTTLSTNQSFYVDNKHIYPSIEVAQKSWREQVRAAMNFVAHHEIEEIAQFILCYRGVDKFWCRTDCDSSVSYISKYLAYDDFVRDNKRTEFGDYYFSLPQLDEEYYDHMMYGCDLLVDTIYGSSLASDWLIEDEIYLKRFGHKFKDDPFFK